MNYEKRENEFSPCDLECDWDWVDSGSCDIEIDPTPTESEMVETIVETRVARSRY